MIKCDICGKFISYESLEKCEARRILITPDSAYSSEEYETLCKNHNQYNVERKHERRRTSDR